MTVKAIRYNVINIKNKKTPLLHKYVQRADF